MVTLREILQLKFDTTALELTARDPEKLRLIQEFVIGPDAYEHTMRTPGLRNSWLNNTLVFVDRTINHHNEPTKRGPEMGWSVDYSQIAPELLQAELVTLNLWWSPLRGTKITADILLPRIQVEAANAFYGEEAK